MCRRQHRRTALRLIAITDLLWSKYLVAHGAHISAADQNMRGCRASRKIALKCTSPSKCAQCSRNANAVSAVARQHWLEVAEYFRKITAHCQGTREGGGRSGMVSYAGYRNMDAHQSNNVHCSLKRICNVSLQVLLALAVPQLTKSPGMYCDHPTIPFCESPIFLIVSFSGITSLCDCHRSNTHSEPHNCVRTLCGCVCFDRVVYLNTMRYWRLS